MKVIDVDKLWYSVLLMPGECGDFLELIGEQPVIELDTTASYEQLTAPKGFILLTTEDGEKQCLNVDQVVRFSPRHVGRKAKTDVICSNDDGFVVEESVDEVLFLINNARRQS